MKVNPFEKKCKKSSINRISVHTKKTLPNNDFFHYFPDHIPARFVSHSQKNEEKKNLNVRKWNQKKKIQEIDGKKGGLKRWEFEGTAELY